MYYIKLSKLHILTKENLIHSNYRIQFLAIFLIISWSQNIKHTEIKLMNYCVLYVKLYKSEKT